MHIGILLRLAGPALAIALGSTAARADNLYRDEVSADSFGNLVVQSASGYKRIVVGAGELAAQLGDYGSGRSTRRGESDELDEGRGFNPAPSGYIRPQGRDCIHSAVLLQGRGYMYGLPKNAAPVLTDACE